MAYTKRIPLPNGTTIWVTPMVDPPSFDVPALDDPSWQEVHKVTTPSHSGGEERFTTFSSLCGYGDDSVPVGRSPIDIMLPVEDAPGAAYIAVIASARDSRFPLGWAFKLPTGACISWAGYVSGGVMPQMERNNLMVLNYSIRVIGTPKRVAT